MFSHIRVLHLSRHYKRLLMLLADSLMIPFALWSALALRLGSTSFDLSGFWWLFVAAPLVSIPCFIRLGLYRAVIRYMGSQASFAVLKGVTLTTVALMIMVLMLGAYQVPRSVFAIFWLIAVLYVGGSRFFVRAYYHWIIKTRTERELVAIYGAGSAGVQLASALMSGSEYLPVAYIDDSHTLNGSVINGIQVYSPDNLEQLVKNLKVTQVLLAMPSINRIQRQAILNRLEQHSLYVRTVPSMPDLVSGKVKLDEIRDVDIEDLLGRDSVPPNRELLSNSVENKVVMVTGAAGSIGSELCRQILESRPKQLLLFEQSEFGLYSIEKELRTIARDKGISLEIISLLGCAQKQAFMEKILTYFGVEVLFHAAAYKHVPMVEHNIVAGVRNNVFGTFATAAAAAKAKVGTFVLVSTDKAVRPTNVMGATKRLSELILQALSDQHRNTCFCMVRFGNVLDSSGSVVPLFRKQIQEGGPVTVTHPEVSRYFMTIPEAAQLVVQAGAIAKGGEVFVLDMGDLVSIVDLAHRMIHLMGHEVEDEDHPQGDIPIEYTGLRPGEKLREELLIGENLAGTRHGKILQAKEEYLPWEELNPVLEDLEAACNDLDYQAIRDILLNSVVGFKPQHDFVDSLLAQSVEWDGKARKTKQKVTELYPSAT